MNLDKVLSHMKEVSRLIKRLNFDLGKLCDHGFKVIHTDPKHSSCRKIYVHQKNKIVVKNSFLDATKPLPSCAIPTVRLSAPKTDDYYFDYIYVQPLADLSDQVGAMVALGDVITDYNKKSGRYLDDHKHNFGHWRGEPVLIDW